MIFMILLMLVSAPLGAQMQVELLFGQEGLSTARQNANLLTDDPLTIGIGETSQDSQPFEWESDNSIRSSILFEVRGNGSSVTLPLSWDYKRFSFQASIPWFLSRSIEYSDKTREASGLGDISAGVGYTHPWRTYLFGAKALVKFPTGDETGESDGYPVPLGTGSTDMAFTLTGHRELADWVFDANIAGSINGSTDIILEGRIDSTTRLQGENTITNGDVFQMTFMSGYTALPDWRFALGAHLMTVGEGESEVSWKTYVNGTQVSRTEEASVSNHQDMTLVDLRALVSYDLGHRFGGIWQNSWLTLNLVLPVVTSWDEDYHDEDRGITIGCKFSRAWKLN